MAVKGGLSRMDVVILCGSSFGGVMSCIEGRIGGSEGGGLYVLAVL